MSLYLVKEALERISSCSKRTAKETQAKLAFSIPFFKETVIYAYDIHKVYNLKRFPSVCDGKGGKEPSAIFSFLDRLAEQKGTSKDDMDNLWHLCPDDATCEVVGRILKGDLRCGLSIKTWMKLLPNKFTPHEIMLCECAVQYDHREQCFSSDLEDFVHRCGGWRNIIGSIKANGVRNWAVVAEDYTIRHLSRNGKLYSNFYKFDEYLLRIVKMQNKTLPYIFDTEVVVGNDDLQDVMKQARRLEDLDDSVFKMIILDLPSEGLDQEDRSYLVTEMVEELLENSPDAPIAANVVFDFDGDTDEEMRQDFEDFFFENIDSGVEGFVLKKRNAPYDFSRSFFWCKVKDFHTVTAFVTDKKEGTGKNKGKLGALTVDIEGVSVDVGSGYSDKQRELFWSAPPKIIDVRYKMKTADGSLQFPVFLMEREDLENVMVSGTVKYD